MANFKFTKDIVDDVLFRAGERTDGSSEFQDQALIYVNRAWQAVWMGGEEIDPTIREDWLWLRKLGVMVLSAGITDGSAATTKGSATITFSVPPVVSVTGYYFRVKGWQDVYTVTAHTANSPTATIDGAWTGPTTVGSQYDLFRLNYDLPSDFLKMNGPFYCRSVAQAYPWIPAWIDGMDLEAIKQMWPADRIVAGVPSAFAFNSVNNVRFNVYPLDTLRVEFDYTFEPAALTYSGSEEPAIPHQYRKTLADAALAFLYLDKNDDRATIVGAVAKAGLQGMARDNRAKRQAISQTFGKIYPRIGQLTRSTPFRTSGGLIVG